MMSRRPSVSRNAAPSNPEGRAPRAIAATKRPACKGLNPSTSWKRWVVMSCAPAIVNIANAAARTPPVKALLRKIENSKSGSLIRR